MKNSAVVCKIPTTADKNFTDQINTSTLYTNFPVGNLQAIAEFFKNSGKITEKTYDFNYVWKKKQMALKFKTEFFNNSAAVSFSDKILRGEINKCHRKRNVTFFDLLKCQFCKFELKILELFSVEHLQNWKLALYHVP